MLSKPIRHAIAFCALLLATASAATAQDSPKQQLQETIQQVIDILHADDGANIAAKRERVLSTLERNFSFDIIIRRALGRNWNSLDAGQQEQVTTLISDLLIMAYTKELKDGPKPQVQFSEPVDLGANKIEIPSLVGYESRQVGVSYRLANIKGRGWQVYDVLVEGVSMVNNYRKQFDEHFQSKSGADLIKLLRGKLADFETS